MKNKKIIIGIVLVLLVAALIYNLNKKPKVVKKDDAKAPDPNATPGTTAPKTTPGFDGYGGHDGMYGGGDDNYILEDSLDGKKRGQRKRGAQGKGRPGKFRGNKGKGIGKGLRKSEISSNGNYSGDNILQAGADAAAEPTN